MDRPCTCDSYGSTTGFCTWARCTCWHHDDVPYPHLADDNWQEDQQRMGPALARLQETVEREDPWL
jgi:hypothetical protein